jgi:hypothetical protein
MSSLHIFKIVQQTGYIEPNPQTRMIAVRPRRQGVNDSYFLEPGVMVVIQMGEKNQSIMLDPSEAHDLAVALQYYADELHLENKE